jgi:hypothetical protein
LHFMQRLSSGMVVIRRLIAEYATEAVLKGRNNGSRRYSVAITATRTDKRTVQSLICCTNCNEGKRLN